MNLEARYETTKVINLFTELENEGYSGFSLLTIIALIEGRLEEVKKEVNA
jgi:hypothetical protein